MAHAHNLCQEKASLGGLQAPYSNISIFLKEYFLCFGFGFSYLEAGHAISPQLAWDLGFSCLHLQGAGIIVGLQVQAAIPGCEATSHPQERKDGSMVAKWDKTLAAVDSCRKGHLKPRASGTQG